MIKLIGALLFFGTLFFLSCGGSSYYQAKSSISSKSEEQRQMQYQTQESNITSSLGMKDKTPKSKQQQIQSSKKTDSNTDPKKLVQVKSKIIYGAQINIEVKDIKEAQDNILKTMGEFEGFIESQYHNKIVLRIPSDKFNGFVEKMLGIGNILQKRITSFDISDSYMDIERRLNLAEKSKDRLLDILAKTSSMEEKIKIIQEIQRLTKQIETFKNQLSSLDSFVNFSVVEILLSLPSQNEIQTHFTPFTWINQLTPENFQLKTVKKSELELNLPSSFIDFEKEDTYIARSPDGAFVRAGKQINNPYGDNDFWKKALDTGMTFKNFEKKEDGKNTVFQYSLYEYKTLKPFYYLVLISVKEKNIYILEVFFADKEIKDKYYLDMLKALSSFKVK